jgi:acyl carrier protein
LTIAISDTVKKCVQRVLQIDLGIVEINSREDLDAWDSLAHMEIILRIEESLNIVLPEDKVAYIDSLDELIQVVKSTYELGLGNGI